MYDIQQENTSEGKYDPDSFLSKGLDVVRIRPLLDSGHLNMFYYLDQGCSTSSGPGITEKIKVMKAGRITNCVLCDFVNEL